MKKNLTQLDWLQAGFRALSIHGPQALKAEPLAKTLKVSKGSFYWHFSDIADFKTAMISHWKTKATADVITAIESGTSDPADKLYALAHRSTAQTHAAYGGAASESAIRDWARYEADIARVVAEIDLRRLTFTESLFRASGQEKPRAQQSARLLYAALIGLDTLASANKNTSRQNLSHLVTLLLKQP